jgi:AraC-like DNA-binding protein
MKSIKYQEYPLDQPLAQYIDCFWQFDYFNESGASLEHTILPDGCCSIVWVKNDDIPFQSIMLFGPQVKYYQVPVPANTRYLGIRILPHYFYAITGVTPSEIRTNSIPFNQFSDLKLPLDELLDMPFTKESLQRFCESKIPKRLKTDDRIEKAIMYIKEAKGNVKMQEVAQRVHLSDRQFQRLFKTTTGYTPKEYGQVIRFRIALIELFFEEQNYQDVVFENGYFDQSHLFKDFYKLLEQSPEQFKGYINQIEHLLLTTISEA